MKKIFALFSSLLILSGIKAQTKTTIKKETVKPVVKNSVKTLNKTAQLKLSNTSIKNSYKENKLNPAAMKQSPVTKPIKE